MSVRMPLARTEGILVEALNDECVVYDLDTNKASCLNAVSARIWNRCDGVSTVAEVAESLGREMDLRLDDDFVWLAITDLERNGLLAGRPDRPSGFENPSRRKILVKYALPALILPLVVSIAAPAPADAASAGPCQAAGTFYIISTAVVDCGINPGACPGACATQGATTCCSGNGVQSFACGSFCTCQCN